ncbi:MAG: hypothetical protein ACRELY_20325 [Polyangiaceae bacterium]
MDAPAPTSGAGIVRLELAGGALHVAGSQDRRLVVGACHASDATLLPHVTVNARGASIVQDFAPESRSAAQIGCDLKLGTTPVHLDAHVINMENDIVDLGGVAILTARLYNEAGHMDLDWTKPNPGVADYAELWSIGYLSARHLARARAKRIELKSVGFADLDVGELNGVPIELDVVSSVGTLVLTTPAGAVARATIDQGVVVLVDAPSWKQDSPTRYLLGAPDDTPQVVIRIHSASGSIRFRPEDAR